MALPTTTIQSGGSSNVVIDGSLFVYNQLTGLDANGQLLTKINVRIEKTLTPQGNIYLLLPNIESINNRVITFDINSSEFDGTITVVGDAGNTINGQSSIDLQEGTNIVTPVFVGSSNNWIIPELNIPA
jgi:hypothetical protein